MKTLSKLLAVVGLLGILLAPTTLAASDFRKVVIFAQQSISADTWVYCKWGECGGKRGGPGAIFVLQVHDLESGTNTAQLNFYYLKNDGSAISGAWASSGTVSTTTTELFAICSAGQTAGVLGVDTVEPGCMPPVWGLKITLGNSDPITVSVIAYYMDFVPS